MVNAAGPWVDQHNALTGQKTTHQHLYSKGIHLIVPQLTATKRVLAFFADDGRLFFVIPMGNRTCIGTTDTHMENPEVDVTADDIAFVLERLPGDERQILRRYVPPQTRITPLVELECGGQELRAQAMAGAARTVDP